MRFPLTVAAAFILVASGRCAPVPDSPVEAHYRGEPVDYWIARLKAKDWPMRIDGARGLGMLGADAWSAVPALLDALDDDETDVRLWAATALGKVGKSAAKAIRQNPIDLQSAGGSR